MVTLFDLEIAHLARVMGASMIGDLAGPILPGAYWRRRLHQLLDAQQPYQCAIALAGQPAAATGSTGSPGLEWYRAPSGSQYGLTGLIIRMEKCGICKGIFVDTWLQWPNRSQAHRTCDRPLLDSRRGLEPMEASHRTRRPSARGRHQEFMRRLAATFNIRIGPHLTRLSVSLLPELRAANLKEISHEEIPRTSRVADVHGYAGIVTRYCATAARQPW